VSAVAAVTATNAAVVLESTRLEPSPSIEDTQVLEIGNLAFIYDRLNSHRSSAPSRSVFAENELSDAFAHASVSSTDSIENRGASSNLRASEIGCRRGDPSSDESATKKESVLDALFASLDKDWSGLQ
jgi:hypothetical protein